MNNDIKHFSIIEYLDFLEVDYKEQGKNIGYNQVGICCPRCGDENYHLNIDKDSKLFNCWRCNLKGNLYRLISVLEKIPILVSVRRIKGFIKFAGVELEDGESAVDKVEDIFAEKMDKRIGENLIKGEVTVNNCKYLTRLNPKLSIDRKFLSYIQSRNFTTMDLQMSWEVMACVAGEYGMRLIFPLHFEGKVVNYLARDVTDVSDLKYRNCPNIESLVNTNDLLYGEDGIMNGQERLVLCEGVFDAIRVGGGLAVGMFGKKVSRVQLEKIVSRQIKTTIYIALDGDAFVEAQELKEELDAFVNCEVKVIALNIGQDPASMKKSEFHKLLQ